MRQYEIYATDIGNTLIAQEDEQITNLCPEGAIDLAGMHREPTPLLKQAIGGLRAYLDGERGAFASLPLSPNGTGFQKAVWQAILEIPYGQTASCQQLAEAIGKPAAAQDVIAAIAENPIFIAIPCHRVDVADGDFTRSAYGEDVKKKLLAIEGAPSAPTGSRLWHLRSNFLGRTDRYV